MKKAIATSIILISLSLPAEAGVIIHKPISINMKIIKRLESSGNKLAVSHKGAKGLYQVMDSGALADWNKYNKRKFTKDQMFVPEHNYTVAHWYFHKRIPQMLRAFKKPVTLENVLACYNSGIGNFLKYGIVKDSRKYIKNYRDLIK